jgi:hypothetical protein
MKKLMISAVALGLFASASVAYARGGDAYAHPGWGHGRTTTRVVYRNRIIVEQPVIVGPSCMQWDDTLDQWENICN